VRDTGYLLTNSQLATVVLPVEPNVFVKDIVRISGGGSGGWRTAQATNQSIIGNFGSYRNSIWLPSSFVATGSTTWRCLASSSDGTRMYAGAIDNGFFPPVMPAIIGARPPPPARAGMAWPVRRMARR